MIFNVFQVSNTFLRKGDETYRLHNHNFVDDHFDKNDEETMKAWGYEGSICLVEKRILNL